MGMLHHIGLYVKDLEGARAFFEKYFGGVSGEHYYNPRTGFHSYFIRFGGGSALEVMTRPEVSGSESSPFGVGYAHIALTVGMRADVDALAERLLADGYETVSGPRMTGDGYYECCVAGPEGVFVEIAAERAMD